MDTPQSSEQSSEHSPVAPSRGVLATPRRWLRGMYDWTISWAAKSSALAALFGLAFVESSVFPIPPDPLLMAIAVARPKKWWRVAAVCTAGSVLGGLVGYLIGWGFMETLGKPIIAFYHAQHHWDKVEMLYEEYGVAFLLGAAFTPIPFKVATIAAGATQMKIIPFALTALVGRAARFFLVAGLIGRFGPGLKDQIERHFDWLSLLFLALLVIGFLALKLFL